MQIELVELYRRVHPRLRTPVLQRDRTVVTRQLADGERLVEFDDLLVEWSEFRLLFRQVADVLQRCGAPRRADHARLQVLVRDAHPLEALARDYYRRTSRPDRLAPPPADQPALIDEVLALALRPFLTRCAESWTRARPLRLAAGLLPALRRASRSSPPSRPRPVADLRPLLGAVALPGPTCPFCASRGRAASRRSPAATADTASTAATCAAAT